METPGDGSSIRNRPQPAKSIDKIAPLTGLRFFAAIAVVFFHFGRALFPQMPGFLMGVATGGAHGVTLFYMLSGFVLAYNYANPERPRGFRKMDFWVARFARIYPVYALSLLISLNKVYFLDPLSPVNILRSLAPMTMVVTLTQAWEVSYATFWNFPAWTLSDEAFFYLVFPWACAAVCKLKPARIIHVALVLWLINLVTGVANLLLRPANPQIAEFLREVIAVWPPLRIPEFLLGLVLGRLYLTCPQLRIRHRDAVATIALLVIVIIIGLGPSNAFTISLLELPFGLLIYALASGPGYLYRLLSIPLVLLLGEASYAIYILQVPIMHAIFRVLGQISSHSCLVSRCLLPYQ